MKNQRGFSLMEVLIAITLIALFGAGAAAGFKRIQAGAKVKKAREDIKMLGQAVDRFEMDNGQYPEGLKDLVENPGELPDYAPGGYLDKGKMPVDPWKHDYSYEKSGGDKGAAYDIVSPGADGQEGTDDDVRLSKLE